MSASTTLRGRRHPPRTPDPSAALRPKNALEKQAMQQFASRQSAFRQKVQTANEVTICNSTSDKVGRLPLRSILTSDRFCVPIFQRRYCWTETQWKTLLEDAWETTTNSHQHSLGRLTCTNNQSKSQKNASLAGMILEGRSCILDGQQRFTTVTILLAAIRDLLEECNAENSDKGSDNQKAIHAINDLLFINQFQLRAWIHNPEIQLHDGIELDFCRLVPTYCDRRSYYAAILPRSTGINKPDTSNTALPSWNRPLDAKKYFVSQLKETCSTQPSPQQYLLSLLNAVLDGLTMLYFPVDIHKEEHKDGTQDLMVIYERLALRDATFCKPTRVQEYHSMNGTDMIRNLLLGSFGGSQNHGTEDKALQFYKTCWLPLEQLTEQKGVTMESLLKSFLLEQKKGLAASSDPSTESSRSVEKGIIGGQIYADFQAWFGQRQRDAATTANEEEADDSGDEQSSEKHSFDDEKLVETIGQELVQFAATHDFGSTRSDLAS